MTARTRQAIATPTWPALLMLLVSAVAQASEEFALLQVADPYIELHSGPGSGYPIFHVVDREDYIQVLTRKTDWFKVRTRNGKIGWVARAQLEKTLTVSGERTQLKEAALGDFGQRRWEFGLLGGAFNDTPAISIYGAYAFNANLSAELTGSQVLGDYSSSYLVNANLLSQPFPRWRVSPFFTLGGGYLSTRVRSTLVPPEDSDDFTAHVGLGLRAWLSRRFILRADFKRYITFSSNDDNKEYQEWKAGFAFFF